MKLIVLDIDLLHENLDQYFHTGYAADEEVLALVKEMIDQSLVLTPGPHSGPGPTRPGPGPNQEKSPGPHPWLKKILAGR